MGREWMPARFSAHDHLTAYQVLCLDSEATSPPMDIRSAPTFARAAKRLAALLKVARRKSY